MLLIVFQCKSKSLQMFYLEKKKKKAKPSAFKEDEM